MKTEYDPVDQRAMKKVRLILASVFLAGMGFGWFSALWFLT